MQENQTLDTIKESINVLNTNDIIAIYSLTKERLQYILYDYRRQLQKYKNIGWTHNEVLHLVGIRENEYIYLDETHQIFDIIEDEGESILEEILDAVSDYPNDILYGTNYDEVKGKLHEGIKILVEIYKLKKLGLN